MTAVAERVVFPFAQALPAAAALWKLARMVLDDVEPARQQAAATAMEQFRGNYAERFASLMHASAGSARAVAQDLEQAAMNLAEAWAAANFQQQTYAYYAMVRSKRDHQSLLDKIGNWITGDHTNYGSPPAQPAVPGPPDFAPTAVPQAEVPGESYVIG